MAINMQDKKGLFKQIVSEADFNISSVGITVISPRLSTPRFIPFDDAGKCRCCKATEVELDSMITKEGITIWCTRMKAVQFVPFDHVHDLPGHCFFKIKNKARVFNIPYGDVPPVECLPPPPPPPPMPTTVDQHKKFSLLRQVLESNFMADVMAKTKAAATDDSGQMSDEMKRKAKLALQLLGTNLVADSMGTAQQQQEYSEKAKLAVKVLSNFLLADELSGRGGKENQQAPTTIEGDAEEKALMDFYNKISAATAFMDTSKLSLVPPPPPPPAEIPLPGEQQQQQQTMTDEDEKLLLEFYDSISAATTYLEYAQQQDQPAAEKQQQEEALRSPPLATSSPEAPHEEAMNEQ